MTRRANLTRQYRREYVRDPFGIGSWPFAPPANRYERAIIAGCQWCCLFAFVATVALVFGAPWEWEWMQ